MKTTCFDDLNGFIWAIPLIYTIQTLGKYLHRDSS